jgi:hypothetical protein
MKRIATSRTDSGYILASVVILQFVLVIVASAFLSLSAGETKSSQQYLDSQRAFWLAEGARHRAIYDLANRSNPPEGSFRLYDAVAGPDGGTYTVDCLVDSNAMWAAQKAFVLDCVGTMHGVQRRLRDHIQMTSFARYAYFTDAEQAPGGEDIWFTTGDNIEGSTHTNGTFHVYGSPRFRGAVTSASNHMVGYSNYWVDAPSDWPIGGNNPTFDHGFQLSVGAIPLPTNTNDLKGAAQNGGVFMGTETDLQIGYTGTGATSPGTLSPGYFRYRNWGSSANWTVRSISSMSTPVFYCNNDLHVKGVLSGELTIASNKYVRIEDNITYAASTNGQPSSSCRDLLGIVAEKNVVFENNTANQSNLVVDAVMMALGTSITAEDYDSGATRGTLTIWGGLIQKYRGAVCTISGGVINHGYRKDYHYDSRVTGRVPPGFPLTGNYEELAWEETWDASDPF